MSDDIIKSARPGDVFRTTRYMTGQRSLSGAYHDTSMEGREVLVLSSHKLDGYRWNIRFRDLENGEEHRYDHLHDRHDQQYALVRRGDGVVIPGITFPFTARELRDQRWKAFVDRVEAASVTYEGFTNPATYLATLYLENERTAHARISDMRRKDGTINPSKVAKLFRDLRLRIDEWAYAPPIEPPAEFAECIIPGLSRRLRVNWDEVAVNINRMVPVEV